MINELGLIICPNPKCNRKIEELILLSDLSTGRAEQYFACPHCFIKLDPSSIRPRTQREEPPAKLLEKEEKGPSRCAGYLGYLATFPENKPIPQECLVCPKALACAMNTNDS